MEDFRNFMQYMISGLLAIFSPAIGIPLMIGAFCVPDSIITFLCMFLLGVLLTGGGLICGYVFVNTEI